MTTRLASALGLVSLLAPPASAELPQLRNFECDATVRQEHYHLLLSRSESGAHLQVRSDTATVADGPAVSYRDGTRYFVATGTNTGIKLSVDRDPARICFGAGGTDCYTCAVPPRPARDYTAIVTCPGDGFTLSASQTFGSYPDIVVKDEHGNVIASGPGTQWGRISNYFTLPIGPGESYQVEFSESQSCTSVELPPPSEPQPPIITDANCVAGSGRDQYAFELRHVGDEAFGIYFYGPGGYVLGPLTALSDGRWLLTGGPHEGVTYRALDGGSGEICDGADCVTCTSALD
jgi:hypothetical protein